MKKWIKILMHSLFWFYIFAWRELIGKLFVGTKTYGIKYFFDPLALSHYVLFPLAFYFNYFFILPRYYKKRKFLTSWIGWILLMFSFIGLRYFVQEVWFWHWLGIKNYDEGTTIPYYIYDNLYYSGILIIMSTLLWILDDNFKSQKENLILIEEKKTAQLAFLKNQVNPHFIFNTLNNIYSLVSSKSDKALPSIEKLSQLMRYMYKDSEAQQVSLQNEIDYIKNFIDLQSIRLSNKDSIHFSLTGDFEQYKIAALLLIPFIENMFKHGILNRVENPLEIHISIESGVLHLDTSNYINTLHKDEASGIGLDNVTKRLLLLYPNKHTLQIETKENIYTTSLQITL